MQLTTGNIRTISKTGKIIFEYPEKTLLDDIPSDLWSDVIPYYEVRHALFIDQGLCIGNYSKKYPGYHLLTHNECYGTKFVNLFRESYLSNNGLFSLDACTGKFIFIKGCIMRIDSDLVSVYKRTKTIENGYVIKTIRKGDIVRLEAANSVTHFKNNIEYINFLYPFGAEENGLGLFVKNGFFEC